MSKYDVTVERNDKYRVEFDKTIINEEWMKIFREVFFDFHTYEEHAEHIAQHRARFGAREIEGYGIPLENGKPPYWAYREPHRVNHGINLVIISEDEEIETYSTELEEEN